MTTPQASAKPVGRKRARSQEDKDQRRAHLVAAAAELFAQGHYDSVTIARVAEKAGVAKGTAYLYFATKETLFLELVRAELTQWLSALSVQVRHVRAAQPAEAVAKAIAHSLYERAALRRLLVLLHSVLELNIAEDTARSFKHFMRDLLHEASGIIAQAIPGLRLEDAQTLVLQTHALVISVTQLSEPPAVVARVMEADPSLHAMRIAFEPFVAHTLATLLRGMLLLQTAAPSRRTAKVS